MYYYVRNALPHVRLVSHPQQHMVLCVVGN
jgi:hypothetical protein